MITTDSLSCETGQGVACLRAHNSHNIIDEHDMQIKLNPTVLREQLESTFRLVILPSGSNLTSVNDTNLRMNVNHVTFAILISILLVADIFLIWCLGYIVIHYELRGRQALRHYKAIKRPRVAIGSEHNENHDGKLLIAMSAGKFVCDVRRVQERAVGSTKLT